MANDFEANPVGTAELLDTILEYHATVDGCVNHDEEFMDQYKGCANCSDDQDLKKCWKDYFIFYRKNKVLGG